MKAGALQWLIRKVTIEDGNISLQGQLVCPAHCKGIILFAHGSHSSRFSPRNCFVARLLNKRQLGTFLFDLLSPHEATNPNLVFDIPYLGRRLVLAYEKLVQIPLLMRSSIGLFGASTGAGAAIWAAASLGNKISAIVSRGGRPDLALPYIKLISTPTCLIVGGEDSDVIQLNRQALPYLSHSDLVVIPNAGHLFEEPGKLEEVARLSADWFNRHFEMASKNDPSEDHRVA